MKLNLAVQWYFFEYIALNSDSDSYLQKNDIANAKVKVYIIILKYINNFLKSAEKSFYKKFFRIYILKFIKYYLTNIN